MLIAPCTVKTLAATRAGYAEDLISWMRIFVLRRDGRWDLDDIVDHSVLRMMDHFGIESDGLLPGGEVGGVSEVACISCTICIVGG